MPMRRQSLYGLRKLHRQHQLKLKKLHMRVEPSKSKILKHDQAKLRGFSPIVELEESGHKEVVFFNYAVFRIC